MKVLLDRWQFGVTITYHFLFVPLTIGLAFLVAIMQVLALRDLDPELVPGRPVALAGPSGSSKTLVVLPLLRFLDVTAGKTSPQAI
jgi:ABC-type multidrug transport system fused ATPase/permease subunit